ncbi:MAG: hypothetical protein ACRDN9_06495 [Streptosporangiaceae bacterium]
MARHLWLAFSSPLSRWWPRSRSLAALVWRERCRARDVRVTAAELAKLGLIGVPLLLLAGLRALRLT